VLFTLWILKHRQNYNIDNHNTKLNIKRRCKASKLRKEEKNLSVSYRNQTTGILERAAGFSDTDAVLSPISRNPIQNKAVYDALAQKIEKTVADLENYYNTSQTYNKQEVRELIGSINTLTIEVVATLPTEDISSTTIYFVGPKAGTSTYDEYVYVNNAWVQIGDTEIDLSNYVTSTQLTAALQSYYTKTQTDNLFNDYYDKDTVDDLLDLKQDVLTFDNSPTSGSANPVTSNGIRTAINNAIVSSAGGSIIKVHHMAGSIVEGDIVTASKGDYSVSSTFDNSGNAIIIGFGEIGDRITIVATNGTDSGAAFIDIPCFSSYSTVISYGVDYKSWLTAGGINPSYYSNLDEVLADEEAIRRLMTVHASVDYLVTAISSVDDEDALAIFYNDICAKWINLRDYALDTFATNEFIAEIMDDANKYGYGELIKASKIPTMTSATAPYGEASASSTFSADNFAPWRAFNGTQANTGSASNSWLAAANTAPAWLMYKFPEPQVITSFWIELYNNAASADKVLIFQGSNDNSIWVDLDTSTYSFTQNTFVTYTKKFKNNIAYQYYRLYSSDKLYHGNGQTACCISRLQFYKWEPKGNVPIMSGNSAPYGSCSASQSESSTYPPYRAFDGNPDTMWSGYVAGTEFYHNQWVRYDFIRPLCVRKVMIYPLYDGGTRVKSFIVQGSNDGFSSEIVDIYTGMLDDDGARPYYHEFDNDDYYLSYRLFIVDHWASSSTGIKVKEIQFYGRELSATVPLMTTNTTPYGEAIATHEESGYGAYKAFDNSDSTYWAAGAGITNAAIGYDFDKPIVAKYVQWKDYGSRRTGTYKIQGFDGSDWVDITDTQSSMSQSVARPFTNNTAYTKYRFQHVAPANNIAMISLQFFGFDYSEREFEVGVIKKWIYDHGVELEPVTGYVNSSSSSNKVEKRSDELFVTCGTGAASGTQFTGFFVSGVDLTDYSIMKIQLGTELKDGGSSRFGFMGAGPGTAASTQASVNITARFPMCLDISSVMGDSNMIYPVVNTGNEKLSVKEWWLEG
jgi:hypothetical protein